MSQEKSLSKYNLNIVGVCTPYGVVLAVERDSVTHTTNSESKFHGILAINEKIIAVAIGTESEVPPLIEYAITKHNDGQSLGEIVIGLSNIMRVEKTNVELIFAGVTTDDVPELWYLTKLGEYNRVFYAAFGSERDRARYFLNVKYKPLLSLQDTKRLSLFTLRYAVGPRFQAKNIDVIEIPTTKIKMPSWGDLVPPEMSSLIHR
ncbi:proteasome subunit alpha type-5-like [Teleopsis dalmanni]|uniref:proteasome subunit alpha type-5-like n=1 Tax=Teleopsis dalmanni TaxID=139649 RepID=UPI0018CD0E1D|nr:proteasome subunit alpha type-5-like [Teleopsis dalmanni]